MVEGHRGWARALEGRGDLMILTLRWQNKKFRIGLDSGGGLHGLGSAEVNALFAGQGDTAWGCLACSHAGGTPIWTIEFRGICNQKFVGTETRMNSNTNPPFHACPYPHECPIFPPPKNTQVVVPFSPLSGTPQVGNRYPRDILSDLKV